MSDSPRVPVARIYFPDGTFFEVNSILRNDGRGMVKAEEYSTGISVPLPRWDSRGNPLPEEKGEAWCWCLGNLALVQDLRLSLREWARERGLVLEEANKTP